MKKYLWLIPISLIILSCDNNDNPTQPINYPITEKINKALPVDTITVNKSNDSSDIFVASHFASARAEEGFLIITVNSDNKRYYNLSSAKAITIESKQSIIIEY